MRPKHIDLLPPIPDAGLLAALSDQPFGRDNPTPMSGTSIHCSRAT
jgi:hypothetical protein